MLFDVAVAGSAPRTPDTRELFTPKLWESMKEHFASTLEGLKANTVIGFGQAGADLLANWAYLAGHVESLEMHTPGTFDRETKRWVHTLNGKVIANRNHVKATNDNYEYFQASSGCDPFMLIERCFEKVSGHFELHPHWDFFRRNEIGVAKARVLIMYSRYESEEEFYKNRGGTQFTARKHQISGNGYQIYVPLSSL